ncbi:hypothetical protein CTI12_AA478560 [Artemisia annua]|uniref:Uncharacterized protein n=1 Tax=Artemisia annua TaxID=35608 RepID=A0A2U1LL94_ARTAN|nr:hypothetical protein CTI12_AA478560 [Artemisia annua]
MYEGDFDVIFEMGLFSTVEILVQNILSNMSLALDRILSNVKDPFEFLLYHEAIREPFNYYMFVQNYICPVINFRSAIPFASLQFCNTNSPVGTEPFNLQQGWLSSGGMAPAAAVEVGTDDSMMVDKLPKQISDMKIIDDMVEKKLNTLPQNGQSEKHCTFASNHLREPSFGKILEGCLSISMIPTKG